MAILNEKCPRDGKPLDRERPVLNALSRLDNQTYICRECGDKEAMFNYYFPNRDLPPLDQEIELYMAGRKY